MTKISYWFRYGGQPNWETNALLGNTKEFDRMVDDMETNKIATYDDIIAREFAELPLTIRAFIAAWYRLNVEVE